VEGYNTTYSMVDIAYILFVVFIWFISCLSPCCINIKIYTKSPMSVMGTFFTGTIVWIY